MPGASAALIDDREIRRVKKQQMEGFPADAAMKEAAKAHAVKPCLCFLRAALVQLHAIGIAVIALRQLSKRLAAAAAGIQQVRGHAFRKSDPPQKKSDIIRVCWVIAQLNVVHQPTYHRSIGLLSHRKG